MRAVFVPLARLQRDLDAAGQGEYDPGGEQPGSGSRTLKDRFTLEDLGLKLRTLEKQHGLRLKATAP